MPPQQQHYEDLNYADVNYDDIPFYDDDHDMPSRPSKKYRKHNTDNNIVFDSPGYDLDHWTDENCILEMGGGVTHAYDRQHQEEEEIYQKEITPEEESTFPTLPSPDDYKQLGNEAYREKNWLRAIELYTAAIDATPGMTAQGLLYLKSEWDAQQEQEESNDPTRHQQPFTAPAHEYGEKLAVYHCNRAAVYLQLQNYEEAIRDCTVALLWNPCYAKAYGRRCTAYEQTDRLDMALDDAVMASDLLPSDTKLRRHIKELEERIGQHVEKINSEEDRLEPEIAEPSGALSMDTENDLSSQQDVGERREMAEHVEALKDIGNISTDRQKEENPMELEPVRLSDTPLDPENSQQRKERRRTETVEGNDIGENQPSLNEPSQQDIERRIFLDPTYHHLSENEEPKK